MEEVVLKVFREELTVRTSINAFSREIGVIKKLEHGNILPILDYGLEPGPCFWLYPMQEVATSASYYAAWTLCRPAS
jgi:hypothetical protein